MSVSQRRLLIEADAAGFPSIGRQCELLGISRSSYYYEAAQCDERELAIMRALDELHLEHPYFGYRRLTSHLDACLSKDYLPVNEKMVRRLLQIMAVDTLYPKRNLSKRNQQHKVFPYLLRRVPIIEKRQVYSTDITYIPMAKGFMYLTAVIDWFTRFVLSWRISNTLNTDFCLEVVDEAFSRYGKPQVFNTDQGCQYTSEEFAKLILGNGIKFSMDGKGRALDNVYIERFWRSLKQEYVYIFVPESGMDLYNGLAKYFDFYNFKRKHQSINNQVPASIFIG